MKKIKKLMALILALFILSGSCFAENDSKIEFETKDINNNSVTSDIFSKAEITMVNVWGTFCGPCINEMPDLGRISGEYEKNRFQIVGIVIDAINRWGNISKSEIETAQKIAKKTGANYTHIIPDSKLLNGILSDVYAVPATFFVDKNGKLTGKSYMGSRSYKDWKKIIENLLKDAE